MKLLNINHKKMIFNCLYNASKLVSSHVIFKVSYTYNEHYFISKCHFPEFHIRIRVFNGSVKRWWRHLNKMAFLRIWESCYLLKLNENVWFVIHDLNFTRNEASGFDIVESRVICKVEYSEEISQFYMNLFYNTL